MDLVSIANATIPAAQGKKDFKKEGQTSDIIAEVLAAFKDSREQLNRFAPHLQAATLPQTLYNVWHFWKSNIKYQVDPANQQWIQTPAALWQSRVGDCKSLSLAVMCTLDALGIKAAFRFSTYKKENKAPTHVYSIVNQGGKIIPVDCVWTEYGTEKPFAKKWDYNMTAIYRLSGFDAPVQRMKSQQKAGGKQLNMRVTQVKRRKGAQKMPERGRLVIPEDNPNITPQVVDMLLKKQRMELEQKIHVSSTIGAIGDTYDRAFEMQIAGIHNALAEDMNWPRVTVAGFADAVHPDQRNDHALSGIESFPLQQEAETVAALEGFFGKIFKGIGKGLKKVVTAPVRLVAKGVKAAGKLVAKGAVALKNVAQKVVTGGARNAIVDQLPQVAPMFLYLFITDPKILAKLPAAVAAKRAKALEYKKIITGKLMLSESNFTGAVRNGIMVQFNLSPEALIAKFIADTNYQVSGILDTALGAAGGLLKKILGNVGENLGTDAEQYAPAPEDWGTVTASATDIANSVVNQPGNIQPQTSAQLYEAMQRAGQYSFGPSAPAASPYETNNYGAAQARPANGFTPPEGSEDNGDGTFTTAKGGVFPYPEGSTDPSGKPWPKTGTGLTDNKDLTTVEVKPGSTGSSNTPLLIGGLALGALLLMSRKK